MGELQEDSPGKAWEASPVCQGPEPLQPLVEQLEVSTKRTDFSGFCS